MPEDRYIPWWVPEHAPVRHPPPDAPAPLSEMDKHLIEKLKAIEVAAHLPVDEEDG